MTAPPITAESILRAERLADLTRRLGVRALSDIPNDAPLRPCSAVSVPEGRPIALRDGRRSKAR